MLLGPAGSLDGLNDAATFRTLVSRRDWNVESCGVLSNGKGVGLRSAGVFSKREPIKVTSSSIGGCCCFSRCCLLGGLVGVLFGVVRRSCRSNASSVFVFIVVGVNVAVTCIGMVWTSYCLLQ